MKMKYDLIIYPSDSTKVYSTSIRASNYLKIENIYPLKPLFYLNIYVKILKKLIHFPHKPSKNELLIRKSKLIYDFISIKNKNNIDNIVKESYIKIIQCESIIKKSNFDGINFFLMYRSNLLFDLRNMAMISYGIKTIFSNFSCNKILLIDFHNINKNIILRNIKDAKPESIVYTYKKEPLKMIFSSNRLNKYILILLKIKTLFEKNRNYPCVLDINGLKSSLKSNKMKKKILVFLLSLNHYRKIKNVLFQLAKENKYSIYTLHLSKSINNKIAHELIDNNIHPINASVLLQKNKYYNNDNINEFKRFFKKLISNIDPIKNIMQISDLDSNSFVIKNLIGNNALDWFFQINLHFFLDYIIKLIKPELGILLNEIYRTGYQFNQHCKKNGVETILIPHGYAGGFDYGPLDLDYAFLSGKMEEEYYNSRKGTNISKTKIFLLGNPFYDEIWHYISENSNQPGQLSKAIKEFLKIEKEKKIVLLVTNPIELSLKEMIISSTIKSLEEFNWHLIIKLHPREIDGNFHKKIIERYDNGENVSIIKHGDKNYSLYDLLSICDLVVGRFSNVLLEAVFFNKPIIEIDYDNNGDIYNLESFGASLRAINPKELKNYVEKIFSDKLLMGIMEKGRTAFKSHFNFKFDGKSTERIVSQIIDIIE